MAEDIRIRVLPKVEKGDSASELSKIISDLEQNAKKIKVGLDDKELLSQIAKLKEFERDFHTSIHLKYKRNNTRADLDKMANVYEECTGVKISR